MPHWLARPTILLVVHERGAGLLSGPPSIFSCHLSLPSMHHTHTQLAHTSLQSHMCITHVAWSADSIPTDFLWLSVLYAYRWLAAQGCPPPPPLSYTGVHLGGGGAFIPYQTFAPP